ncbi:hypothetical protein [Actinospica robiniae]|uniref:hypothetical protein n=1 Tax=Actinospica robiniae TaxID=304901 RepID=UPI000415B540|nr:hypothetical protein [Actinospica robiniae]
MHDDRNHHDRSPGLGRTLIKVPVPATTNPGHFVPDGGSPGISHSVWLPPAGGPGAPVIDESELPAWALMRIAAQFLPNGGALGISHGPGPGRTGLDVTPTVWAPEWMNDATVFHGAEPIRGLDAALVIADPLDHEPAPDLDTAVPFFRELRRAAGPGGVVLVHTHQATGLDGMLDPTGPYVRAARYAGLGYLQHHVIVHTRLLTEPLSARDHADRPAPRHAKIRPRHRRVHSDLIALQAN